MFLIQRNIRIPVLLNKKRRFLSLSKREDRQFKYINCSKKRPSGVSSIKCMASYCFYLEDSSLSFLSTMLCVKHSGFLWDSMLKSINLMKIRSMFTENTEFHSWPILKMNCHGNSSHRLHAWSSTQVKLLLLFIRSTIDLTNQ